MEKETEYHPDVILKRYPDDIPTDHNSNYVARNVHVNKSTMYSFYVDILHTWINERKHTDQPVSRVELYEAILSAVRWTSSLSQWAYVFQEITNPKGVVVILPDRLKLQKNFQHLMIEGTNKMVKCVSYESPLPLHILYICKSLEVSGSLCSGTLSRFQAFSGNQLIVDLKRETQSFINLTKQIDILIGRTDEKRRDFGCTLNSDENSIIWAEKIRSLTQDFVLKVSMPVSKGGVFGVGQLLAHHIIGIAAHGSWVDFAHLLNTSFSKGTGCVHSLVEQFGLNATNQSKILDILANDKSMDRFGINRRSVTENVACKMISSWRSNDVKWSETINVGPGAFLVTIKNGELVACIAGGKVEPIKSSYVSHAVKITMDEFDLSVVRDSPAGYARHYRFWQESADIATLFSTYTFDSKAKRSNNSKSKRRSRKRSLNRVSKLSPNTTSHQKITKYGRSKKWGYFGSASKQVKSVARKHAQHLVQMYLHMKTMSIPDIASSSLRDLVSSIEKMENDDKEQLCIIRDEIKSICHA